MLVGFFYYLSTVGFLKGFDDIRKYYRRQWYVVPLLPFFNLFVFFIRFAGVINSINTDSAWKVKNFTEERKAAAGVIRHDMTGVFRVLEKIRKFVNVE